MCAPTVKQVLKLLKRSRTAINWTRFWYDICEQPGSKWSRHDATCEIRQAVPQTVIERLKRYLESGRAVRAGVLFGRACDHANYCATKNREPGHFVLIIGHNNANRFVYWNTVQRDRHKLRTWGSSFGVIDYEPDSRQFHMVRQNPTESHPILLLDSPW